MARAISSTRHWISDELAIPGGDFLLYASDDGRVRLSVRVQDGTVWLPQAAMAELFQTTKQNISLHLQNVYEEMELRPEATVKQYLTVQTEGGRQVRRLIDHYNLDAILAVGYRVRSIRGTQFRQWATTQLRELLVKGFVLDDERLKARRERWSATTATRRRHLFGGTIEEEDVTFP